MTYAIHVTFEINQNRTHENQYNGKYDLILDDSVGTWSFTSRNNGKNMLLKQAGLGSDHDSATD